VIRHETYPNHPWQLREVGLPLEVLAQSESLFALSNGHIGLRGNLDEGEPYGLPGSYLNGVHELRPLPYAEHAYGYPESGQTIINVTNGKVLRLLVDDEPLDVRYGEVRSHERVLDFRSGVMTRDCRWVSPAGQEIVLRTQRLVSLTQRSVAAISFEVTAIDDEARVVVQSELIANEAIPVPADDPRAAAALTNPLVAQWQHGTELRGALVHRVRHSGLLLAAAMDHDYQGPQDLRIDNETSEDLSRISFSCLLAPGETLRVVKFVTYGWSAQRSLPALRDQVWAALQAARHTGWDGLVEEQRAFLNDFWAHADVEIDGDDHLQQAVRFALFHILQTGARAERQALPAKGLTGTGYDGHSFWDTESFVLPVLTHTLPRAARDALHWRLYTLPEARARAEQLGLAGAAFPWRTIAGKESSGYWPASTAAFHLNADIADAVVRYVDASDDRDFERNTGLPLLVETARLWQSLGHEDDVGFRIDGVTGPDEYSALGDNNVYTNLMAQRNLRAADDACRRHPEQARTLQVTVPEVEAWRRAAARVVIPWDDDLRVHPQCEGFTRHQRWDFAGTGPEDYPLLLHFPYFDLYRKQVVKQSDLVLAMHLCPDAFTPEQKRRNFDYYEELTVRDSSLSACTQAVLAAEVGHLELAHAYAVEAALMDLDDLEHNTRDGLHLASLAGAWIALIGGFGGMRDSTPILRFAPRLPASIHRLRFIVTRQGHPLQVTVTQQEATYQLQDGDGLTIEHHGEQVQLEPDVLIRRAISPLTEQSAPRQPPGRAPLAPNGQPSTDVG
jgi:alpha,alpha-trehalose phosphorylase